MESYQKKSRAKWSPVWRLPKEQFQAIVYASNTFSEVLRKCGLSHRSWSVSSIKRRIEAENIDASHIKRGRSSNQGRKFQGKSVPLELVMVEHSTYNRGHLKKRLIDEGLLKNECAICSLSPVWNGKPLVLRLDHKNGIADDHRFENLQLVCPNCDSQLPTFSGRNRKIGMSSNVGHGGFDPLNLGSSPSAPANFPDFLPSN